MHRICQLFFASAAAMAAAAALASGFPTFAADLQSLHG
jgi:hypothetical protein